MAQFTKQVPITAYRFMPEELTEWQREYPDEVVEPELDTKFDDVEIGNDGNL